MTELAILKTETHNNLKIDTRLLPELGYATGTVMVMPNEILETQREFPLVFRKNPETGEFYLTALLGFEEKQNLFLDGSGGWSADYLPMVFARGPLMISYHKDERSPQGRPVLSVDLDDPRVNKEVGEPIFDEHGNPSKYLESVNETLATIDQGIRILKPMIEVFNRFKLIEPVKLDLEFDGGQKIVLTSIYAVSEERLRELTEDQLKELNDSGYLKGAFYLAGSLANVSKLVTLKNSLDREIAKAN